MSRVTAYIPLVDVGYKYKSWEGLGFIDTKEAGSIDPCIP